MRNFEDLKLDASLAEYLHDHGYRRPTALQLEAVPVISRGTTVVGNASAGSGKTLAYGLGLATRIDPAKPGTRALVLLPTEDAAARAADSLYGLLQGHALSVSVAQPQSPTSAQIVFASPNSVLATVERSAIKLDQLEALVVDDLSAMLQLGAGPALETVIAHVPKDAQRVLLTSDFNPPVEDWMERHARRARRLAYLPAEPEPLTDTQVEYFAAPPSLWLPALVRLLDAVSAKGENRCTVWCRFEAEAHRVLDHLTVRGYGASGESATLCVQVGTDDATETPEGVMSVSWGVPADVASLRHRAQAASRVLVLLEPRELAHLHRLASCLAVKLSPIKGATPVEALRSAQVTRDQLRDAAAGKDLDPYILLLEPLLDEFTPTELAAAATALLRERTPAEESPPLPSWTRLYFGVGRRDDVRPKDLVGAITGEASIPGDRIGRIEIRDNHSSVEVAASVADQVIKSLATATIRGRPANVRVFRE